MLLLEKIDLSKLPKHIAIIMDGNGRWAKKKNLPRVFGHRAGMKSVQKIVETCVQLKIEVLTLYAFSTENWIRPKTEIGALMTLLQNYLKIEFERMMDNNIQLRTIGDISKLPKTPHKELVKVMQKTKSNTGLVLNLALNYGSRQEIMNAITRILESRKNKVDQKTFESYLDTSGLPDPDLIIRTSGEMRLSNFLLWQCAYSELYVTPVLWPDFKPENLYEAIADFQKRERRFGGV
ncbi:MAG: isoprenyl transferase [Endomicrobiales bacterium]|nr:isoprenyl transferase [Endomicrobiales bacterium]